MSTGSNNHWTSREAYLLAMVALFVGLVAGFLFHGTSVPAPVTAAQQTASPGAPAGSAPGSLQSPEQLNAMVQPMLDAARANPSDPAPLIELGNTYYDHRFYPEAVKYYARALELKPADLEVRTDMATAMFYSGAADKAVVELDKVLQANPKHASALFNLGIVRMDGLNDRKGAIAAWERLLAANPDYPQKQKVLELIAKARSQS